MSTEASTLPEGETRTNLIVNYLPQSLTDQEFYKIFLVAGPIKNCRIMKDLKRMQRENVTEEPINPDDDGTTISITPSTGKTGYSFGFGFVEYQRPEDAAKAILQLNNLPVQHKRIKVSYARPPGEDIKETNLYVQNIPRDYTLDQLEELFSSFGHIVQKNILKDKTTGLPRGVGFVRYDKKSEAEAAILGMNGVLPSGGTEPLVVKVAEEHGKMKAAYYAGYYAGRGRGYNMRGAAAAAGFQARGNFNNVNQRPFQPPGGKMVPDRATSRYNPIGSGGGYSVPPPGLPVGGFYGSGGAEVGQTDDTTSSYYNFSTPSFSGGNYTSFTGVNSSGSRY